MSPRCQAAATWLGRLYSFDLIRWAGWVAVGLAIALTVIRGLPVLFDAMPYLQQRNDSLSAPGVAPVGASEQDV